MTIMEGSCYCAAKPLGVLPLQLALPYPEPGGGLGRALAERLLHTEVGTVSAVCQVTSACLPTQA